MRLTRRLLRPGNKRAFWWAVALTLLAAVLRGADLLGRSLWMDEGITYMRIAPSLTDMLRNVVYVLGKPVIDTQPPVYFLLLKAWILFGGDSEFSLKWLTAILGVVVVPLTFAVGKHAFGARAGLIAAFFVLLSPGVQWYAHELRMYTAVICIAAFTVYALHHALRFRPGGARWWLVAALAWVLALLTHYTFVGLVAGQVMLVGVVALARWRVIPPNHKRVLTALVVLSFITLVGLLLLPDVQAAFRRLSTGREVNYNFVPLDVIFWTQFNGFLFGLNTPDPHALLLEFSTWVVVALCVISVVVSLRRRRALPGWLVLVSVLMPVLVWFGISFRKPNYQGFRHLMLITPFMAVLLGQLAAALWQRGLVSKVMGGLLIAAIAVMQVYGLAYSFMRTPNWHDDFRGLAYYIRNNWHDGDVIVIPAPVQAATVMPYLRGFPWRYFPESTAASAPKAAIDDVSRQQARKAFAAQFRRVWYMPLDYETGAWFARDFFSASRSASPRAAAPFAWNFSRSNRPSPQNYPPMSGASAAVRAITTIALCWQATGSLLPCAITRSPTPSFRFTGSVVRRRRTKKYLPASTPLFDCFTATAPGGILSCRVNWMLPPMIGNPANFFAWTMCCPCRWACRQCLTS